MAIGAGKSVGLSDPFQPNALTPTQSLGWAKNHLHRRLNRPNPHLRQNRRPHPHHPMARIQNPRPRNNRSRCFPGPNFLARGFPPRTSPIGFPGEELRFRNRPRRNRRCHNPHQTMRRIGKGCFERPRKRALPDSRPSRRPRIGHRLQNRHRNWNPRPGSPPGELLCQSLHPRRKSHRTNPRLHQFGVRRNRHQWSMRRMRKRTSPHHPWWRSRSHHPSLIAGNLAPHWGEFHCHGRPSRPSGYVPRNPSSNRKSIPLRRPPTSHPKRFA